MKYSNQILNIALLLLGLKLSRNIFSYYIESNQGVLVEKYMPAPLNFIEFFYPLLVFAVTMILARFLIDRPNIFARNLFILVQIAVLGFSLLFAHMEWYLAAEAVTVDIKVNYIFLATEFFNCVAIIMLIYCAYRIERDSRLISKSKAAIPNP